MIKTFKNKALAAFHANARDTRRLPVQNTARITRILTALDAATKPSDLNLPGLRFHSLEPGQPGRFSVWVSGNYRITFGWDNGAEDVDIEDYH
jgi:proteic killer suppression protein